MILHIKPMQQLSTLQSILNFLTEVTPFVAIFGGVWKMADVGFKYFSDARKEAIKEIVNETVKPQMEELTDSIKELREAIWALKNK